MMEATTRSPAPLRAEHALLWLLAALWGGSYTLIRIGVETIPPLTLIAIRTVIAGTLLLLWMQASGIAVPKDAKLWRSFLVQSLLNSVLPFTLIAWAEQSVEAGLATILNSTSPVFTFLAAWLFVRHEPVSGRKLFGVAAGLAGVCLVVGSSALAGVGEQLLPQLAIVVATVCYAGAALYGRSFREYPAIVPAAGSMLVGALIVVPASLVVDRPWTLHPSATSLAAVLVLSVFSSALAMVIYFRLIRTIGPIATTAQAYLRVPIGVGLGIAFLGESLSATAWLGLLCVVAGVAAMTHRPRAG